MSEIRSVSVHLDADIAGYVAKMRLAGAETDKAFRGSGTGILRTSTSLDHAGVSLNKVGTEAKKSGVELDRFGNKVDNTRTKVDAGLRSIDRYSGRLGALLDIALALGPALVPLGAVTLGGGLGIGADLAFAGTGAATAIIAFKGLGKSVQALNKAALEPTVENLKAAREELDKLPPAERAVAVEISHMMPLFQEMRTAAAQGIFPGVREGLQSLRKLFPEFNQILYRTGFALGNLAADAGKSLSGPEWRGFIDFISREAPAGLDIMGRSLGHVAHGIAELVMAGAPLEHDFNRVILQGAEDFDRWAGSLSKTQGFQDFIDYIKTNGPIVGQFLREWGDLLINLIKAAAPLGGPVLQALTSVAQGLNALGDAGPTIYATIIALRLLSRTQQLFGSVAGKSWVQAIRGAEGYQAKLTAARPALLRGGLAAAGLALAASGTADKLGLANTATLALTGSLAGPWGAAAGAAVGLFLDLHNSSDNFDISAQSVTETLNQQTGALTQNTRAYVAQQLQQQGVADAAEKIGVNLDTLTSAALGQKGAMAELTSQMDAYQVSIGDNVPKQADFADAASTVLDAVEKSSSTINSATGNVAQFNRLMGDTPNHFAAATSAAEAFRVELDRVNGVLGKRQNIRDYQQALDDLTASVKENGRTLDVHTQKGRNNQAALDNIAKSALAVADTLKGTDRQKFLTQARSDFVDAARKLGISKQAAENLANQLGLLDAVRAAPYIAINGIPQSLAQLRAVYAALAAIRSKTITVTTNRVTGGSVKMGNADGGTIPGQRYPYGDKVLSWMAPGEEVISNRHGEADRFRADRAAGRIPHYADGGTVHSGSSGGLVGDSGVAGELKGLKLHLRNLRHELELATKALDKERSVRDNLVQAQQSLVTSVRDTFRSDFLGVESSGSVWANGGTMTDPLSILRADAKNARKFTRLEHRLADKRHVSAGVLSNVGTLAEAQQLAGLSDAELRRINRAYAARQRASKTAGSALGDDVFGKRLGEANRHLVGLRHDVHQLNQQIKHLEAEQAKNAKKTGDAVGDKINGSSGKAARRVRRT